MKLTQYDRVLDHLQRNGKLSQKQAPITYLVLLGTSQQQAPS